MLDIPLLHKIQADKLCNITIGVKTLQNVTSQRLGYNKKFLHAIRQRQKKINMPYDINKCRYLINNSGDRRRTEEQCINIIRKLGLYKIDQY